MTIRKILGRLSPPLVTEVAARILRPPNRYTGPYPSWSAAIADAAGYAHEGIVERVVAATREVLAGRARFEQDGMTFSSPPPPSKTLDALLLAAALDRGDLSVLDFGGGLASHFLRWRGYFEALPSVSWEVVEQPGFVAAGRTLFDGTGIPVTFHAMLGERTKPRPSAALASSVLQYLEHPMQVLADLCEIGANVLILDRTPLAANEAERIFVQHVSRRLYPASYPLQTLSQSAISGVLGGRYKLLEEFDNADTSIRLADARADFMGSIWLRRDICGD